MKSGSAASSQEAALPQILVASTAPAGMSPAANCMPSQPQASRLMAIHTPAPSRTVSTTEIRMETPMRSIAAALQTPLETARSMASSAVFGGSLS
jgi:hypothetical protein